MSAELLTMEPEVYHADYSRVSQSMLKVFMQSRRKYYAHFVAEPRRPMPEPSDDMRFGTCIHAGLFEPEKLGELFVEIPKSVLNKDGHCKGTPYTNWAKDQPESLLKLLPERVKSLHACIKAVREVAGKYIDAAETEKVIQWTDDETGIACRGRVDIILDLPNCLYVPDVKSCRRANWDAFRKQSEDLKYWLQSAHYRAGLTKLYGKPVRFAFIPVQTEEDHWATIYPLDHDSEHEADVARRRVMNDLAACMETGVWCEPDEITREPLVMRPWAFT